MISENKGLVTVYITTHNRCEKLIRAVDSVLSQSYRNIEIIISDDGSEDNTPQIASEYVKKFPNIKYVRNETPRGATHARNRALDLSAGDFITGLDDDDIFRKNRIEFLISRWDDKYAFICDNFVEVRGKREEPYYVNKKEHIISLKEICFFNTASNQIFTKLSRIREIGGFNETFKRMQDWDCWLRMIGKFGTAIRFNEQTYVMYHDEENRVSKAVEHDEAYRNLITNNIELYNSALPNKFTEKYFLRTIKPNVFDLVKCKSLLELKKIVKFHLGL